MKKLLFTTLLISSCSVLAHDYEPKKWTETTCCCARFIGWFINVYTTIKPEKKPHKKTRADIPLTTYNKPNYTNTSNEKKNFRI
ncbi:MAG: hypothetical protein WBQ73_00705 [Candidatus Babeliales bacterium]